MNVLHPTLLAAGLATIAVPILIHLLLRKRFRPIPWAAMRFVQIAQTQQRRRRRIEQILLLIARCLLLAAVAIGVARPFFGEARSGAETTLVLLIDDGLTSSAAGADNKSSLDAHKLDALKKIDALSPASGDRVAIVTMASPPKALIYPPTSDFTAARRSLELLEPADSTVDIAGSLSLIEQREQNPAGRRRVAILSDWRAGSLSGLDSPDPSGAPSDQDVPIRELVLSAPAQDERPNLRIKSFEISRATILTDDTPAARQAVVEIDRIGPTGSALGGVITIATEVPGSAGRSPSKSVLFEIPAGERSVRVSMEIPSPLTRPGERIVSAFAAVSLSGQAGVDSIEADSTARVALRFSNGVNAGVSRARGLAIDGISPAAWVAAALRPSDTTPVRLRDISPAGIDAASLVGLDLVAVARPDLLTPSSWENLAGFAEAGGTIVLFVPDTEGSNSWTDEITSRYPDPKFPSREPVDIQPPTTLKPGDGAGVFSILGSELGSLASTIGVSRVLPIEIDPSRVALTTADGRPVLSRIAPNIWMFTVAASTAWSDLPARPLFVPLIQELARRSPARTIAATVIAGTLRPESLLNLRLENMGKNEGDEPGLIVGNRAFPSRAGGRITFMSDGSAVGVVAVNPDPDAGVTTPMEKHAVAARLESVFGPGEFQWDDAVSQPGRASSLGDSSLGWLAFAAAGLLAVLESFIAALAGRRGAGALRGAQR